MHEVDLTSRRPEELDRFLQPLSKSHVIVEERMYMLYVGKVPELMESTSARDCRSSGNFSATRRVSNPEQTMQLSIAEATDLAIRALSRAGMKPDAAALV